MNRFGLDASALAKRYDTEATGTGASLLEEQFMIELTERQRQEMRQAGWPPELVDPQSGEKFVLIHKEMFDRVRAILEREDEIVDVEAMLPLVSEALSAGDSTSRESA